MKHRMFKSFLLVLIITTFFNCQEQDDTILKTTQSENRFTVKTIDKKELDKKPEIVSVISKFKSEKSKNTSTTNRQLHNDTYNFSIDTNGVKYLEDTTHNYHSYSFPVIWDIREDEFVYNLLLSLNEDGSYSSYIVEYGFTQSELNTITPNELSGRTTKYYPIDFDTSVFNADEFGKMTTTASLVCVETWTLQVVTTPHQGQLHGAECDLESCQTGNSYWVLLSNQCTLLTSGGVTNNNNNQNNTNPNSNYGNGSTSVSSTASSPAGLTTGAILIYELSQALNITSEIAIWLEQQQNWGKGEFIKNLLEQQGNCYLLDEQGSTSSPQCDAAVDLGHDLLALLMADPNLTFEEAIEIYVFGEQVDVIIEGPDIVIENMADYLSCFDTISPDAPDVKITIYVDEPVNGSNALVGADGVGHTFVSIKQGDNIASFGFYPTNSLPSILMSVDGVMGDNSNTEYDVSITIDNVSSNDLQSIINLAISYSNSNYDLEGQNCTDVGIDIANLAGLPMPECNANPIYFFGSTPGRAGEYIRNLTPLPSGITRNTDGGISASNNCN